MHKFAMVICLGRITMNPTGDLLQTETGYRWTGGPVIRTTYDMLLYGLPDCEAEPPLSPGSQVRVGPYRLRVLQEEPDTATVLLIRERGLMLGWRLRRVALRAALALGRWAEMEGTG